MNYEELMSIKVIPKDIAKSQSKSLVNNLYHTPYKDEIRLFSCIKQGNLKKLIFEMTQLGIQNITVGQMSDDELKQQKYMAVSFITLATRYAIQGGMNENNAYSFSDSFILKIDKAKNKAAVNSLIVDAAIELTNKVNLCQKKFNYSPHIRKCVAYINKNLNEKLTVNSVAKYCNLSSDYLSRIFKEEMGVNLSAYITHQKLECHKRFFLKDMTVIIYAICSAFQANLIIFRFLKRSMALLRVNLLHLQGKKGLLKN